MVRYRIHPVLYQIHITCTDTSVNRLEMSEGSDRCFTCKNGYMKPTGEIVLKGESRGEFREIGSKRVYQCDNCKKRLIRLGLNEYVDLADDVRTELKVR